jgi:hypothetical protein
MNKQLVASASQAMMAEPQATGSGYSQRATREIRGLHPAPYFGLTRIIPELLSRGHDPASQDSEGHTPL